MSLDLEAVRMFVKVAELASFTRAAQHLASSKSRLSLHVSALERELGTRLFSRTTRAVRLTADGEQFLQRARRLVTDADELVTLFEAPRTLRGTVRIDLPVNFACQYLIPRLPEFVAAHPQLTLLVSTTDRRVDVVREGFDCVLRVGALTDSGLTARRLGTLPMANGASPAYLVKHGIPRTLDDLASHTLVHYSLGFGGEAPTFEYVRDGVSRLVHMKCSITVNNADAYRSACIAGLGIIQAPRIGMRAAIAQGDIAEVLQEYTCAPMPVSLVHPHGRNVPKRVRAVMAWIAQVLAPQLTP